MKNRMVELYGKGILKRSAISIRDGDWVFELIMKNGGYKTVLEIGTYHGCSSAIMSQYCDKVITIDLKEGRLEQLGTPFDRKAFWKSLDIDNIDLHLVKDNREKIELVDSLDFDFAFIDGSHNTEGVRLDYSLVKRCGTVLFHDYDENPEQKNLNQVFDFVNALPRKEIKMIDIFALWEA